MTRRAKPVAQPRPYISSGAEHHLTTEELARSQIRGGLGREDILHHEDHIVKTHAWCYYCTYHEGFLCRPLRVEVQPDHNPDPETRRKCEDSHLRNLPSRHRRPGGEFHSGHVGPPTTH